MCKHAVLLICILGLTGCPDVDKYAKEELPQDVGVVSMDGSSPVVDVSAPSDEDAEVPSPADGAAPLSDMTVANDAEPTTSDSGAPEGDAAANAADSQVPSGCVLNFIVTIPDDSPAGDIYLAGAGFDAAEWEPAEANLRMERNGTQATLTIAVQHLDRLSYKYTRGSWDTVEGTNDCGDIENRGVVADCITGDLTVEDEVLNWVDACTP